MKQPLLKNKRVGLLLAAATACGAICVSVATHAQDKVVVIPMTESLQAPPPGPPAPLPKSGQVTSYATADDGDLEKGVAWPVPRFTDNNNGTVTDHLTGLVWLKNGKCKQFFADDTAADNNRPWAQALESANKLASGFCDLTDGSKAGDWRLPNRKELDSLIDLGQMNPALPAICPLRDSTYWSNYWSSTTDANTPTNAWYVEFNYGHDIITQKSVSNYVRAVRDGI